ncbi:hypothetical protein HRG84_21370 [Flavisolibacter sp. BT320]|nr:hypothetical protein [Flavisolibacter longurius]
MANRDKDRKSEEQKRFEQADNEGRFAGNDEEARRAKADALKGDVKDTTGYDSRPVHNDSGQRSNPGDEETNATAHRGSAQVQEFTGDAQNVNDGGGRPLEDDELAHARNKANESKRDENSR